jgi:DNA-binding PadR family transcriptional regulator
MNSPHPHPIGPVPGRSFGPAPTPGFGFSSAAHQDLREHRRHGRGERPEDARGHLRSHRGDPFGPGFGREFGGFGPGFDERGSRGGRRGTHRSGRSRRGRGQRGDVRNALLVLLAERPMHGYEMIQEIAERSNGLWKPSPGSVYPTLQMLEDEGLIVATPAEGNRKLFTLTDEGRSAAGNIDTAPWTEIAEEADPAQVQLRHAVGQLFAAVRQSAFAATPEQQQRIVDIVNTARREVYQILGED